MNQGTCCGTNGHEQRSVFRPAVDITETASDVQLVADLPGVDESQLDVTLDKSVMTIRGNVGCHAPEGYTPVRTEYGVGDYERVFTLSEDVNRDGIEATVKDGVLTMKLPKTSESQRRKINVVAK